MDENLIGGHFNLLPPFITQTNIIFTSCVLDSNEASISVRKEHFTHSNTKVETAVTVTCQSKLKLRTMLHSNKSALLLLDPPLNEHVENLFFTIKVHHGHLYHYKHSNIGISTLYIFYTMIQSYIRYCLLLLFESVPQIKLGL